MNKNDNEYQKHYNSHYRECTDINLDYMVLASEWKMDVLNELVKKIKVTSVLEIGCGIGQNLEIIHKKWGVKNIIGIDISSEAISKAKQKIPNGKFYTMDVNEYRSKIGEVADIVLLVDVLEHVEDPIDLLKASQKLGHYVVMKIPLEKAFLRNISSKIKGKPIAGLKNNPAGHLYIWNVSDAMKLVKKSNLDIIECVTKDPDDNIRYYYPSTQSKSFVKKELYRARQVIEKFTCKKTHRIHTYLFGSSLFLVCKTKI